MLYSRKEGGGVGKKGGNFQVKKEISVCYSKRRSKLCELRAVDDFKAELNFHILNEYLVNV